MCVEYDGKPYHDNFGYPMSLSRAVFIDGDADAEGSTPPTERRDEAEGAGD